VLAFSAGSEAQVRENILQKLNGSKAPIEQVRISDIFTFLQTPQAGSARERFFRFPPPRSAPQPLVLAHSIIERRKRLIVPLAWHKTSRIWSEIEWIARKIEKRLVHVEP